MTNIISFKVLKTWTNIFDFGTIEEIDDVNGNVFSFNFFDIKGDLINFTFKENYLNIFEYSILNHIIKINTNYHYEYLSESLSKDNLINFYENIKSLIPTKEQINYMDNFQVEKIQNLKTLKMEHYLVISNPFGIQLINDYKSFKQFFKMSKNKLDTILNILNPKIELQSEYFKISEDNSIHLNSLSSKDLIYFIYIANIKNEYYYQLKDTDFYDIVILKFKDNKGKIIKRATIKRYFQDMKNNGCMKPSVNNEELIIVDLNKIFSI